MSGPHGSESSSPDTASDSPEPGAGAARTFGVLLVSAAALILAAVSLPLATWNLRYDMSYYDPRLTPSSYPTSRASSTRTAWQYIHEKEVAQIGVVSESYPQYFWIPLLLSGAVAVVVGALLLFGVGRRILALRTLGCLTAGAIFGVALAVVCTLLPSRGTENRTDTVGAGFWALVLAAVIALAATISGLYAHRGSPSKGNRVADALTGAVLIVAMAPTVIGSFLDLIVVDGTYTYSAWRIELRGETLAHWDVFPLLLCALVSSVAGMLLIGGPGTRLRAVRGFAAVATGLMFATTLTVVVAAMSEKLDNQPGFFDFTDYVAGFWILVAAVLLSVAAMATATWNFRRW